MKPPHQRVSESCIVSSAATNCFTSSAQVTKESVPRTWTGSSIPSRSSTRPIRRECCNDDISCHPSAGVMERRRFHSRSGCERKGDFSPTNKQALVSELQTTREADGQFCCWISASGRQFLCRLRQQATTGECTRIATYARENLSRNSPT